MLRKIFDGNQTFICRRWKKWSCLNFFREEKKYEASPQDVNSACLILKTAVVRKIKLFLIYSLITKRLTNEN